jgi:hypothetical protein
VSTERTADEVVADPCRSAPPDAIITAIIVVYQYLVPGADDVDDRGPFLAFERDTHHGIWNQLGMVESVANDFRAMLREMTGDS